MCPACIASTAVVVAGAAGSTGGILAVCISKLRTFLDQAALSRRPEHPSSRSESTRSVSEKKEK